MAHPHVLTFELQQHTPLIHFQPEQAGAGLRATEVKPKLDKFIISKFGSGNYNSGLAMAKQKGFLQKSDNGNALDYSLSIVSRNKDNSIELAVEQREKYDQYLKQKVIKWYTIPEMWPNVLANMGGKDEQSDLKNLRLHKLILVTIRCRNGVLKDEIAKNLCPFFAATNFGNRQSKGFGCFYPNSKSFLIENTQLYGKYLEPFQALNQVFNEFGTWHYENNVSVKALFEDIEMVHRLFKTGYNFPNHPMVEIGNNKKRPDFSNKGDFAFYIKGFVFKHFLDSNIGSEKREIKEKLFNPHRILKDPNLKADNRFVRAIFGYAAEGMEYKGLKRNGNVSITNSDIDRFKSSLEFRVFGNIVYFVLKPFDEILGKSFNFSDNFSSTTISTPHKDEMCSERVLLERFVAWFRNVKETEMPLLEDMAESRDFPNALKPIFKCLTRVSPQLNSK